MTLAAKIGKAELDITPPPQGRGMRHVATSIGLPLFRLPWVLKPAIVLGMEGELSIDPEKHGESLPGFLCWKLAVGGERVTRFANGPLFSSMIAAESACSEVA